MSDNTVKPAQVRVLEAGGVDPRGELWNDPRENFARWNGTLLEQDIERSLEAARDHGPQG